jgi:hypothetical protein
MNLMKKLKNQRREEYIPVDRTEEEEKTRKVVKMNEFSRLFENEYA